MNNHNKFVEKIRNRERVTGTLISNPTLTLARKIASAGLDFVFIDNEHIVLDRQTTSNMVVTYDACGMPPIVRISHPSAIEACKALDFGAKAILVPYIETVEQVHEVAGAIKYKQLKGEKLELTLQGHSVLSEKQKQFFIDENDSKLLFANIESTTAIENLDNILNTGFVDGVIIGPQDLSVSLGHPAEWDHPLFMQAVEQIINTCVRHNTSVGIHFSANIEKFKTWIPMGMNIVLYSADITLFEKALKSDLAKLEAL